MRLHMLIPILVVASPLSAQVPWTANVPQRGIALDFLRPKFQGGGTSLTSFAAFLSGRFPLGDKAAVRFELRSPVARLTSVGRARRSVIRTSDRDRRRHRPLATNWVCAARWPPRASSRRKSAPSATSRAMKHSCRTRPPSRACALPLCRRQRLHV